MGPVLDEFRRDRLAGDDIHHADVIDAHHHAAYKVREERNAVYDDHGSLEQRRFHRRRAGAHHRRIGRADGVVCIIRDDPDGQGRRSGVFLDEVGIQGIGKGKDELCVRYPFPEDFTGGKHDRQNSSDLALAASRQNGDDGQIRVQADSVQRLLS